MNTKAINSLRRLSLLLLVIVALTGCSSKSESGGGSTDGGGQGGIVPARASSSELLERNYGYLLKDDRDFARLAPNYSALRPFAPDTSIVIEHHSTVTGQSKPPADFNEYLHVRIHRAMSVRFVVADSTGSGLIVYEFNDLPEGVYTFGGKGWPVPQTELTDGHSWVYVYVVADTRFRYRTRFALDKKGHFVPLTPEMQAS